MKPVVTRLSQFNPKNLQLTKNLSDYKNWSDEVHWLNEFNSKFIAELHMNLKPLFVLLIDNINFHWNDELETLFQHNKISGTKDVPLTLPNINHPFFITKDSSLIGIGCVLFQKNERRKMDFTSYDSRIFTTSKQKFCTTYRE